MFVGKMSVFSSFPNVRGFYTNVYMMERDMKDGLPLLVGRQNYSNKMTTLDSNEGFVVTNYGMDGFGLIGVGNTVGVYGGAGGQGIGIYGRTDRRGGSYAGYFVGDTAVLGDSTVFFGHARIAARHPDQSDRLLYSIASP